MQRRTLNNLLLILAVILLTLGVVSQFFMGKEETKQMEQGGGPATEMQEK